MSILEYDSSELKLLRKAQNEMNRNGQLIFSLQQSRPIVDSIRFFTRQLMSAI
jgi:hypothetical protein